MEIFEELNTTRWLTNSTRGLLRCGPEAPPGQCTMARSANLLFGSPLPFYPFGDSPTGAVLTLSQAPCNDPFLRGLCCLNATAASVGAPAPMFCANWTGAHLLSAGCVHYGTITAELAVSLPPGTGTFAFSALAGGGNSSSPHKMRFPTVSYT